MKIIIQVIKKMWYSSVRKSISKNERTHNVNKDITVFKIADWFLSKEAMTHKKLQKITYYAYSWYYTLKEEVLFPEHFEAWIHGPVCRELWNKYKDYRWNDIPRVESAPFLEGVDESILESVWFTYKDKSANELEALTHIDDPWRRARKGCKENEPCTNYIDLNDIKEFYWNLYTENQGD